MTLWIFLSAAASLAVAFGAGFWCANTTSKALSEDPIKDTNDDGVVLDLREMRLANAVEQVRRERRVPNYRYELAFGIALAVGCAWSPPAGAQQAQPCASQEAMTRQLDQKYEEAIRGVGLQSNGLLVGLYRTADGTTWTIVTMRPDGLTCIVAAGKSWEDAPATPREVPVRATLD